MTDMIPMLVGFFLILMTRGNHERQIHKLDTEERKRLESGFWKWRFYQLLALLLSLFPLLEAQKGPIHEGISWRLSMLVTSVVFFILWMVPFSSKMRAKLKSLEMPGSFIKAYMQDRGVILFLFALLYGKVLYEFYRNGAFQ